MAEPKSTSGARPLTEDEQKTLDELTARRDAAARKQAEDEAAARAAQLAPLVEFVNSPAYTEVMEASQRFRRDFRDDPMVAPHTDYLSGFMERLKGVATATTPPTA
jgi:hypothetical protein